MPVKVSKDGIFIPRYELKSVLGDRFQDFIKKMQLIHKPAVGPTVTYNVASMHKSDGIVYVRIPRSALTNMYRLFKVEVMLPDIIPIACEFTGELTECQQLVVDEIMNQRFTDEKIALGTASAYLEMKAGYGKSYVLAGIISRLKVKTLVVVANNSLARQMYNDLSSCLSCTIGMYNGVTIKKDKTHKEVKNANDYDVTIVIINSAVKIPDICDKFSFIAIDEAQDFCTGTFGKIFEFIPRIAFSMSATPDEKPSCFIGLKHAGPLIKAIDIDGFSYDDVKFNIDVDVINYYGNPEYTQCILSNIGKMDARAMHNQFLQDDFRTNIIVDKIMELYNQELMTPMIDDGEIVLDDDTGKPILEPTSHCIYVFAEELEHLRKIHERIADIAYAPELIGMFTGGITEDQNNNMRKNSRILLTTYGYSAKGVSINKMTAIVFLTSRKSKMRQIIARILRRNGDKNIVRRIIDLVDASTGIRKQYESRECEYIYYGANIRKRTIKYK